MEAGDPQAARIQDGLRDLEASLAGGHRDEHARLLLIVGVPPVAGGEHPQAREAERAPDQVLLETDRLHPSHGDHGSSRLEQAPCDDEPVLAPAGREAPIDDDGGGERDEDRRDQQHPDDQQDGLQIRSVGPGEPVQVHDEGVLRQELERPAGDRGDHGDAATGQAGDEQVAGAASGRAVVPMTLPRLRDRT